jgi:hypothetical protein
MCGLAPDRQSDDLSRRQLLTHLCRHVNSNVYDAGAEVGVSVGWWSCNGSSHYYSDPFLFRWGVTRDGVSKCAVLTVGGDPWVPPAQAWESFRISDVDRDGVWTAYYGGSGADDCDNATMTLDFGTGYNEIGLERGDRTDSGFIHDRDLDEWHTAGNWTSWDDLTGVDDLDSCYYLQRLAPDEGKTVELLNSTGCP